MADPIIEAILEELRGDLAGIAAPTSSQTVTGVYRRWPNQAKLNVPLPAIFMVSGIERGAVEANQGDALGAIGHQAKYLMLHCCFLARCQKVDRETVGRKFAADLETVLCRADRLMGPSGNQTTVAIDFAQLELYVEDIYEDIAGGQLDVQLRYETAMGNPALGTGG